MSKHKLDSQGIMENFLIMYVGIFLFLTFPVQDRTKCPGIYDISLSLYIPGKWRKYIFPPKVVKI